MKKPPVLLFMLAIMLTGLACNVHAQLARLFPPPPPDSKLGELTAIEYPLVRINDEILQLGAGGQIRGTNNFIILPSLLTEFGPILYWIGPTGDVQRIWLLTPEEAAQAKAEEKRKSEQP